MSDKSYTPKGASSYEVRREAAGGWNVVKAGEKSQDSAAGPAPELRPRLHAAFREEDERGGDDEDEKRGQVRRDRHGRTSTRKTRRSSVASPVTR